jgi:hypothetical protein
VGLVHQAYIETQEMLIRYYFESSYNQKNKKQLWDLKKNTESYYSSKKLPHAIYQRLDAMRTFYGQSSGILSAFQNKKELLKGSSKILRELQQDVLKLPLNHQERLQVLEQLYRVAATLNEIDSTAKYLNQILESKAKIYGDESLPYHLSKIEQADYLMRYTNEFFRVRHILDESFHGVLEKRLAPQSFDYIGALGEYATYYSIMGQFDSASYMAKQAAPLLCSRFAAHGRS